MPAAALVPLFEKNHTPHLLLTVRSRDLPSHRGQVSFPGGAQHPGETLQETAIRETHEEVGIPPSAIEILGALTPLLLPSGFLLHPFVGLVEQSPPFRPNPREVARLLEASLDELRSPHRQRMERTELKGQDYDIPSFFLDGEKIWGATAMVLSEFLWILGAAPEPT
jgi:8-oxo-dGTP pyrophosphatase MutT (NUDIX family)